MTEDPNEKSRKHLGLYMQLSQVGLEMVAPIAIGLIVDIYVVGWGAWAAVAGVFVGFIGGMAHLIAILNRIERDSKK